MGTVISTVLSKRSDNVLPPNEVAAVPNEGDIETSSRCVGSTVGGMSSSCGHDDEEGREEVEAMDILEENGMMMCVFIV